MKIFKPVHMSLTVATLSLFAIGCGKDDESRREAFEQRQVEPGTYASNRCFLNKIATQTSTSGQRFSRASITLNADGTGSGSWQVFSDITCATLTSTDSFTFSSYNVVAINGVNVLRLEQSGNAINPTWWIPFNLSDDGYSIDVDYTDGESGPYILEPSAADVQSFGANPAQGVSFDEQ